MIPRRPAPCGTTSEPPGAGPEVTGAPSGQRGVCPFPQDRLTRVQLLFTRNPSPLRSSRTSLEYLLLPPRSAPEAAPPALAPLAAPLDGRCEPRDLRALLLPGADTSYLPPGAGKLGATLQRHPFSGLVDSAGELLHTPWRVPTSMATVLLSGSTNTFCGVWSASTPAPYPDFRFIPHRRFCLPKTAHLEPPRSGPDPPSVRKGGLGGTRRFKV